MEKKNTIGKRIKELRTEKKLSQEKLALSLYVKKNLVCRYEKDEYDIPASKLVALAKALDTTPDYLLLGVREQDEWIEKISGLLEKIESEYIRHIIYVQIKAVAEKPFVPSQGTKGS